MELLLCRLEWWVLTKLYDIGYRHRIFFAWERETVPLYTVLCRVMRKYCEWRYYVLFTWWMKERYRYEEGFHKRCDIKKKHPQWNFGFYLSRDHETIL